MAAISDDVTASVFVGAEFLEAQEPCPGVLIPEALAFSDWPYEHHPLESVLAGEVEVREP